MSTEVVLVGGTIGKRQEAIMIRVLKYFVKFIKNYSSRIPHDQYQLDIRVGSSSMSACPCSETRTAAPGYCQSSYCSRHSKMLHSWQIT
jgi:hypothetical protein